MILLDEIEKAHPDVFNILLQILEEGRLTDSLGRKVDFRNAILIMTSNVGVEVIRRKGSLGFKAVKEEISYEDMVNFLSEEVKKTFKPEFLNRIDDIIVFRPLGRADLEKIVDIEISYVNQRLKEQGVEVVLEKEAKDFFIEKGFDPTFGARPLKRVIQQFLEDPLAESLIRGDFKKEGKEGKKYRRIKAKRKGEELTFQQVED